MDPVAGENGDCLGPSDGGWGAAEGRGLGVTPEHLGPSLGAIQYSRTPGTATEAPHPGLQLQGCQEPMGCVLSS